MTKIIRTNLGVVDVTDCTTPQLDALTKMGFVIEGVVPTVPDDLAARDFIEPLP